MAASDVVAFRLTGYLEDAIGHVQDVLATGTSYSGTRVINHDPRCVCAICEYEKGRMDAFKDVLAYVKAVIES